MKKIYVSTPYFNEKENKVFQEVVSILKKYPNTQIYVSQKDKIKNKTKLSDKLWCKNAFRIDRDAIDAADIVVVLNFGIYSDSGIAWEAGYAYAKEKTVYQILCGEENTDYSLMMTSGTTYILTLNDLRKGILPNQSQIYSTFIQKVKEFLT